MATLVLGLVGCGGSPTAQISGRAVFQDGSPITGAVRTITFKPTDDSPAEIRKAAQGEIDRESGAFTLFTRKRGDGVYKGKYHVLFTVLKDPNMGGLLVPEKYLAPQQTPFSVEVTEDRTDLLFELEKL
ncbi:hypothetical protein Pla111_06750 [Botrimarina hoheduenensis]|uniref:Uncharacterized protein n=1 Tax=Botrimarina hoheduenensis TaxID=2528000 RepID=A0A5C5WFN2_9BACT|nr:hypothetical protein Pla111_06750 [Botrimarina hoheduenensis]